MLVSCSISTCDAYAGPFLLQRFCTQRLFSVATWDLKRDATALLKSQVWLTGSLAWGTADAWSDLDLHAVIADEHYAAVVADRQRLYESFGSPALVQSIKVNTESPAHFNLLVYRGGLEVDCSLWPQGLAHRPAGSRLLFDRAGILVDSVGPMSAEERRREAEHQLNFFWAMAVVAVKCVGRRSTAGAVFMVDRLMMEAYDCLWRLVWRPDQWHPELIARRLRRTSTWEGFREVAPVGAA